MPKLPAEEAMQSYFESLQSVEAPETVSQRARQRLRKPLMTTLVLCLAPALVGAAAVMVVVWFVGSLPVGNPPPLQLWRSQMTSAGLDQSVPEPAKPKDERQSTRRTWSA